MGSDEARGNQSGGRVAVCDAWSHLLWRCCWQEQRAPRKPFRSPPRMAGWCPSMCMAPESERWFSPIEGDLTRRAGQSRPMSSPRRGLKCWQLIFAATVNRTGPGIPNRWMHRFIWMSWPRSGICIRRVRPAFQSWAEAWEAGQQAMPRLLRSRGRSIAWYSWVRHPMDLPTN
jgi:hypothetical protein